MIDWGKILSGVDKKVPVFIKWGRGRPTEGMRLQRKEFQEYFMAQSKKNGGFLASIINTQHRIIKGKIKYIPK